MPGFLPPLEPRKMLFTVAEVAAITGFHPKTIYAHHQRGIAKFHKIGGRLRMHRHDLIDYCGGDPFARSLFDRLALPDVDLVLVQAKAVGQ